MKVRDLDFLVFSQVIFCIGDISDKRLIVKRALYKMLFVQGGSHNSHIQGTFCELTDALSGGHLLHLELHLRIFLSKIVQKHGQQGWCYCRDNPQSETPTYEPLMLGNNVLDTFGLTDNALGLLKDLLPYFCDAKRLFGTVKNKHIQLFLQALYLHAECRLSDETLLGSHTEILILSYS